MKEEILVLGNDGRMMYTAMYLRKQGYTVYQRETFVKECSLVILQPVYKDSIKPLYARLPQNSTIYAGKISEEMKQLSKLRADIKLISYMDYPDFQAENSRLTAEGLVIEAMRDKAVFENSCCLIAGYGNCGKALAKRLQELDASVDVILRNPLYREQLEENGMGYVNLNNTCDYSFEKYSYVVNTIPKLIFDKDFIDRFSGSTMFFDIASLPGGIDFSYCSENNIFARSYPGIPGRVYTRPSGELLAKLIIKYHFGI